MPDIKTVNSGKKDYIKTVGYTPRESTTTSQGSERKSGSGRSAGVKKIVGSIRSPAGRALRSVKDTAGGSLTARDSPGMNSYEFARDSFNEGRKRKDQLAEVLRMVIKVVKAVVTASILPVILVMAVIALLIASVVSAVTGSSILTGSAIPNPTTERQVIYNGLIQEFEGNTVAAIGVMCALMAESGCHANAVEGKSTWDLTEEEYAELVNNNAISKEDFINSIYDGVQASRGYGIAQWSTTDLKKGLYNYATDWSVEKGKAFDIADIEMQTGFLCKTVRESFPEMKEKLIRATDLEEACYIWISNYERPSQATSTWEEKAKSDVKKYADSIQQECTYDMDRGNILWPVPSIPVGTITSKFGYRGDIGVPGATKYHNGIDISAPAGSEIVAVAPGVVKKIAYSSARGNYVVIDHGEGKETLYQHMRNAAVVNVGDTVSAGTLLGFVGSTGISSGPHLHFEVHIGGTPVDPLQYY